MSRSPRSDSDSSRTGRNREPTRLDRRSAAEPVRGQVRGLRRHFRRAWKGDNVQFPAYVSRETMCRKPVSFLICARVNNQIRNPENAATPNARLNFCRKATGLSRACFSYPNTDRARLAPCSGSSGLNLTTARGSLHSPAERPRVPRIPAERSHINNENPAPHLILNCTSPNGTAAS